MPVFRINKTKNYTVMSNEHLKNKKLSLKAKGLLSVMLSLPDEWDYSINGLVKICKENETSIKNTLDELKKFNYLVVNKLLPNQTESGRIEYEYIIYEKPKKHNITEKEDKKQGGGFLGVEFLGLEKQGIENQGQLNTKELNTKNKKKNKKENPDIQKQHMDKSQKQKNKNANFDQREYNENELTNLYANIKK